MRVILLEAVSVSGRRKRLAQVASRLRHHKQQARHWKSVYDKNDDPSSRAKNVAGDNYRNSQHQVKRFSLVAQGRKLKDPSFSRIRPQNRYAKRSDNKDWQYKWSGGKETSVDWGQRKVAGVSLNSGHVYKFADHRDKRLRGKMLAWTGKMSHHKHDGLRAHFVDTDTGESWHIHPHAVMKY